MKAEWFLLYESMLKEIEACSKLKPHAMMEIECCFNIAQKHWSQIQIKMEDYHFLKPIDEIEFYKEVKPLFKSQIEYYNLLYQAAILKPADSLGEMKEFWIKEQFKLDKFIQDNMGFITYYKSGATAWDEEYFLLPALDNENGNVIYPDDLIATLLALESYAIYAQSELSRL